MKLGIAGHPARGEEVIGMLSLLGGENFGFSGSQQFVSYFLDGGRIEMIQIGNCYEKGKVRTFTLEEFEIEYPFRIGDMVKMYDGFAGSVDHMEWDEDSEDVRYSVKNGNTGETRKGIARKELHFDSQRDEGLKTGCGSCGNRMFFRIPEGYVFDKEEDGMILMKPKVTVYPKTYKECCELLGIQSNLFLSLQSQDVYGEVQVNSYGYFIARKCDELYRLLVCAHAYWRLANDWEPDWTDNSTKYNLYFKEGGILVRGETCSKRRLLSFPSREMRDAFYENFKELIHECMEMV